MSFAEVVRRGLERLAPSYPPKKSQAKWEMPKPMALGCRPLTSEQLRDLARGEDVSWSNIMWINKKKIR